MPEIRYSCRDDDDYMTETDAGEAIYQYLTETEWPGDVLPETVTLRKYVSVDTDSEIGDGAFPMREVSAEVVNVREWCATEAPELLEDGNA